MRTKLKQEYVKNSSFLMVMPQAVIDQDMTNRDVTDRCSLTDSDMEAAVAAIKTQMKFAFRMGNNLKLGDIGTFKLRIRADYDDDKNVIRGSERVYSIGFIPNRLFIKEMRGLKFKCLGYENPGELSYEKRKELFLSGVPNLNYFGRGDYYTNMGISGSTATRDIRKLIKEGHVERVNDASCPIYRRTEFLDSRA